MKTIAFAIVAPLLIVAAGTPARAQRPCLTCSAPVADPVGLNPLGVFLQEVRIPSTGGVPASYRDAAGTLITVPDLGLEIGPMGGVRYDLRRFGPVALTAGDLVLTEPGAPGAPSDILRFDRLPGEDSVHSVLFLSDVEEGGEAVTQDTPLGSGCTQANCVTFEEQGGSASGAFYTPRDRLDPGFDQSGTIVSYTFISDVPEPGSASLLLAGLASLVGIARRRRAKGHA